MEAIYLSAILILCGHQVYSQLACQNNCKDLAGTNVCIFLNKQCASFATSIACQRACGLCTPCTGSKATLTGVSTRGGGKPPATCDLGPCLDTRGPVWCGIVQKDVKDACKIYANECKASCKLCKPCKLPPTELACTKDCQDSPDKPCALWKKRNYCDKKKGFPDTLIACPLSCGVCKLCPTEPPTTTTVATTTAKDCSTCKDTNEFCGHWNELGYCNVAKGYPDVLIACPKTCDVCTPCAN